MELVFSVHLCMDSGNQYEVVGLAECLYPPNRLTDPVLLSDTAVLVCFLNSVTQADLEFPL